LAPISVLMIFSSFAWKFFFHLCLNIGSSFYQFLSTVVNFFTLKKKLFCCIQSTFSKVECNKYNSWECNKPYLVGWKQRGGGLCDQ
jgi:hypothetical protein